MTIRRAESSDRDQIIPLIAEFRVTLSHFRGKSSVPNLKNAEKELHDYQDKQHHIFVAEDQKRSLLVGYLVCRTEGNVVWAEALFVLPAYRFRGIGSQLYQEAENLAEELGSDTVYNWIHPNNNGTVAFLQNQGYTTLNLIEVRRTRPNETPTGKIKVGKHVFDY